MYRRLIPGLTNQLIRAPDLGLDERRGLQNHPFVRVGVVAQLVPRRDYFSPLFGISFKLLADDEERRFDVFFIQYRKNLFCYARRRAIIESQRDDLLPRVYAWNDFAEKLKCSGVADSERGGCHGNDRDNDRQRSLQTFTDHLLFSNEPPPRAAASMTPTTRSLIKPRSLPLAAMIRGLI